MAKGASVEGLERLSRQLRDMAAAAANPPVVTVGFTASYAIHVHENMEIYHKVGQAKFLEQPARTMKDQLRAVIRDALRSGKTVTQALVLAGMTLQAAAQKLTPVDTGNLKASAFTRLEGGK